MRDIFIPLISNRQNSNMELYEQEPIYSEKVDRFFFDLIGNYDEFPIKQKHFVQTMRTRTRRDSCFASVLGAGKKDVLLTILNA